MYQTNNCKATFLIRRKTKGCFFVNSVSHLYPSVIHLYLAEKIAFRKTYLCNLFFYLFCSLLFFPFTAIV